MTGVTRSMTHCCAAWGTPPAIGFEQGLAATMRWYRENRHWWEPLKQAAVHPTHLPIPLHGAAGRAGRTARGQDGHGP